VSEDESTIILLLKSDVCAACIECPAGFVGSGNSCYNLVTDNLRWSIAALRCQELDPSAHLVTIGNELEQTVIDDIISEHIESKTMLIFLRVWGCRFARLMRMRTNFHIYTYIRALLK